MVSVETEHESKYRELLPSLVASLGEVLAQMGGTSQILRFQVVSRNT